MRAVSKRFCRRETLLIMFINRGNHQLLQLIYLFSCFYIFSPLFSLVWFLSFWFLFLHYLKFNFETALRLSIFVLIWCFLDFSWFLGLNFPAARTFHFVLISYCRAFWFEFLRFCFCVYIYLQSQLFCFDTCMFSVVYACLFVTLFNDRPVGWFFFLYAFSQGKQNRV